MNEARTLRDQAIKKALAEHEKSSQGSSRSTWTLPNPYPINESMLSEQLLRNRPFYDSVMNTARVHYHESMQPVLNQGNPYKNSFFLLVNNYFENHESIYDPDSKGVSPIRRTLHENVRRIFPKEFEMIQKELTEVEQAHHRSRQALISGTRDDATKAYEEYILSQARLKKKTIDGPDPVLKALGFAIDAFEVEQDRSSAMRAFAEGGKWKSLDHLGARSGLARVSGGVLGGVTMGLGTLALGNAVDKALLSSCEKSLDLSPQEVEFLKNGSFLSSARITPQSNKVFRDCRNLAVSPGGLLQGITEIRQRFGGIPKGVCNILINQSQSLDSLVRSDNEGDLNCNAVKVGEIDDAKQPKKSFDLQVALSSQSTAEAKWDNQLNWINLDTVEVSDSRGVNRDKTEALVGSLNCKPNLVDATLDKRECASSQAQTCAVNPSRGECEMIRSAVTKRFINRVQELFCPGQGNTPTKTSSSQSALGAA